MFFVEEDEEVREEAPLPLVEAVGAARPGGMEEEVEERLPPGLTC